MDVCSYTLVDPQAVPVEQLQFGFDLKVFENFKCPTKTIEKLTSIANLSSKSFNFLVTNQKKKHSYLKQGC
jgi:hypothetical protein